MSVTKAESKIGLGFNQQPDEVVAVIKASDADVVTVQELNPAAASAFQQQLLEDYAYQHLDPQTGVTGMGVLSHYPLTVMEDAVLNDPTWVGVPQVLSLDLDGRPVTILHFHPFPTNPMRPEMMERTIRIRERQAKVVLDFVQTHPYPVIAPVDFNATDQSQAYRTVTRGLRDAWREIGWGTGHTFPGADSPGSSRRALAGIAVPKWLVRIDYVFYSTHFQGLRVHLGPWDGVSDHRPVVATLGLRE